MLLSSHDGWCAGAGNATQRAAVLEGFGGVSDESLGELRHLELIGYTKALCDSVEVAGAEHVTELVKRIERILAGESLLPL